MSFQPAHGICNGLPDKPAASVLREFAREGAGLRDCAGIGGGVAGFGGRGRLKIALRGQDQDRRGRDQEQIVGRARIAGRTSGAPFAAPAAVVARPPSPAMSPPRSGRPARCACLAQAAAPFAAALGGCRHRRRGRRRIAAAVSLAASIWSGLNRIGLDGDAQAAGERRESAAAGA